MKYFAANVLLCLACLSSLGQETQTRLVWLPTEEMNLRIAKREFRDVPQRVRDFHARGTILLLVEVDRSGKARRVNVIRGLGRDVNEYLKGEVLAWKFKPLTRNGQLTEFRGMVSIYYWYGGIDEKVHY